ncbi:asparaginase [Glaciecola sp. MH2013]|uniref:asparaginase n=1 Tax=Glaciecola sp. MH2013 TaxID=2785524 RepID=UPI00189FF8D2|nr:asparaginase [Glaciecola sp. MH2013]MBF7072614.1 asparaginase [Glaciecola sp. MH2013]
MRKHIYVAYTGGTIGMKPSENGFVPAAGYLSETLAKMPEFHRSEMPAFTIHEYDVLLDSSDMSPSDWQLIADDIDKHYDDYDGFIILHGTDTMAYTASALSFMLENLAKPVIVTGSQIPLAELRSDGQTNLLNSLYIAANFPIPEVSLFFNNKLIRGNRSRKVDADGFDAFDSPNFPSLIKAGINIEVNHDVVNTTSLEGKKRLQVSAVSSQPIGLVSLYPGISADVVKNIIQQPVNALILLSYGVGNAPQNSALLLELKRAQEQGIIVVNCTQCFRGKVNMAGYANGHLLQDIGLVSGQDMTPEAALAKLHYLLSKPELSTVERKQLMTVSLRGELSVK